MEEKSAIAPTSPIDYGLTLEEKGKKGDYSDSKKISVKDRHDIFTWLGGILFIFLFCGAMYGIGYAKGYNAESGYACNMSDVCEARFLPEPYVSEPGVKGREGPTASGRWYYWKLKPDLVHWYSKFVPWICYLLHQFFVWIFTYILHQKKRDSNTNERYSTKLTKWNWILFAGNMVFHLIHLLQTYLTYDGLAPNVSIASSQGSVIMLLIFIMLIEYRDRGLLFGWPSSYTRRPCSMKARLPLGPIYLIRRYHGYAFAWASVYTLWYHPLEGTWGHITGTTHVYLVLLQGSLAFTNFHLNKYWRLLLEVWVTLHGGVVASQTGGPALKGTNLWPMFVFGFLLIFFVTQLYGLPFWFKIPAWVRAFPILVIYVPIVLYVYSWAPDANGKTWVRLQEIIRIPAVYYLFFIGIWIWTFALMKIQEKCSPVKERVLPWQRGLALMGIGLLYALFIGVSVLVEEFDWSVDLIMLMIFFVAIFMAGISVTNILFNYVFQVPTITEDTASANNIEPIKVTEKNV